ncbi:MAG: nuclear transport factor 2 family protein [Gemmatimonadaceae bacterium]
MQESSRWFFQSHLASSVAALVLVAGTLVIPTAAPAQAMPPQGVHAPTLRDTIMALDKIFFDAFNACDLETWKPYLAEDIEFYQDNDDVTTTREQLEPSFLDRCRDGNVATVRRELVPESAEVHPIQGYGAEQMGAHRFYVVKQGSADELGGTPRFVHLWRRGLSGWQITRVISYGH